MKLLLLACLLALMCSAQDVDAGSLVAYGIGIPAGAIIVLFGVYCLYESWKSRQRKYKMLLRLKIRDQIR